MLVTVLRLPVSVNNVCRRCLHIYLMNKFHTCFFWFFLLQRKFAVGFAIVTLYIFSTLLRLEERPYHVVESDQIAHGEPLLSSRSTRSEAVWGSKVSLTTWNSFRAFIRRNMGFWDYPSPRFPHPENLPWNFKIPEKYSHTYPVNQTKPMLVAVVDDLEEVNVRKTGSTSSKSPGVIHLIMVFPLLLTEAWQRQGYNISDKTLLKRRELEYVECLRANLRVPTVAKAHIFTDQPEQLRDKLRNEYSVDLAKAQFFKSRSNPTYRHIFEYASAFLHGRLVFVVNADNYLGEGFDQIDGIWWQSNPRTMYALTRHSLPNQTAGCVINPAGHCETRQYFGSHDGFLFHMHELFPENFFAQLEFPSHVYGSENVVIWAFRKVLNFTVTNPCRRLVIYHNHCAEVRASGAHRERVQNVGILGIAAFSDL